MSHLSKTDTRDHKLTINTTWASGQLASIANSALGAVAGKRLEFHPGSITIFIGKLLINCLFAELFSNGEEALSHLYSLLIPQYYTLLGHIPLNVNGAEATLQTA